MKVNKVVLVWGCIKVRYLLNGVHTEPIVISIPSAYQQYGVNFVQVQENSEHLNTNEDIMNKISPQLILCK